MSRPVRVANCSGFYGDRPSAAKEAVDGGPVDVLTGDWLAELTMSILAMDQLRDPAAGFAKSFERQLADVHDTLVERGIRVVSNAGGLHPLGLAARVRAWLEERGSPLTVAVVTGDDLRTSILEGVSAGRPFRNAQTGEVLEPRHGQPLTANAYLGCWGIARALTAGADIVITGRVTDAAVVMGAAAWWHRWTPTDLDPLAGALAAGHVIECGCQATGGNHAFWEEADLTDVGFPLAEIAADGTSVITKHPGTGGQVTVSTVTAQLLYEVGPPAYLSPDVIGHFDHLTLTQEAPDRVRIEGALGSPPPDTLKLGITLASGYRNRMTAVIGGSDGVQKARLFERLAWGALGGRERFADARSDIYARQNGEPTTLADDLTLVDFSVAGPDARTVGTPFTAPLVALALASVPGLTFTTGPQKPQPIGVFWPTLIDRADVEMRVHQGGETTPIPHPPTGPLRHGPAPDRFEPVQLGADQIRLGDRVGARSGDKGGDANVGFWVRDRALYPWLRTVLTEEQLRIWLGPTGFTGDLTLYGFPNLLGCNVVLHGFLGRGVAANLAPDPQAKCLAEFFRSRLVSLPHRPHGGTADA